MKNKKIYILISSIIIFGVLLILLKNNDNKSFEVYRKDTQYIEGTYSNTLVNDLHTARLSLQDISQDLGITSIDDLYDNKEIETEYINYYYLDEYYKSTKVYNGGVIVYADKEGNALGIINNYYKIDNTDINFKRTFPELYDFISKKYGHQEIEVINIIYPVNENEYILAYEINMKNNDTIEKVIVSDKDLKIIDTKTKIGTFDYTDSYLNLNDYKINNEYILQDKKRNIGMYYLTPAIYQESSNASLYKFNISDTNNEENKVALTTFNNIIATYDYYDITFKYKGFNNNDDEILVMIGVKRAPAFYENFKKNAFNAGPYIVFSADNYHNDSIDVMSHEYMHGIMNNFVNISDTNYEGKILFEAYADILGLTTEAKVNNNDKIDGIIGHEYRNIKNTKLKFEDIPTTYKEYNKHKKKKDEHYYSVILSKSAYYMNDDLSLNELEKLWFNSIYLLPKNPTIKDVVYAVTRMSKIMRLSEEKENNVKKAFIRLGLDDEKLIESDIKKYAEESWNIEDKNLTINNYKINYGTYIGKFGATGKTLIIKENNIAILNNVEYKYTIEKYNFAQDISSTDYKEAIILKHNNDIKLALTPINDDILSNGILEYHYNKFAN